MKFALVSVLVGVLALAGLAGCPQQGPVPPVPPDAPDGMILASDANGIVVVDSAAPVTPIPPPVDLTGCAAMCSNLVGLHCPEGNATCLPTCQHAQLTFYGGNPDAGLRPACVAKAQSPAQAVECGSLRCAVAADKGPHPGDVLLPPSLAPAKKAGK